MMKKLAALLLVVSAFGLILSGCSKQEEGGGTETAGATAGGETTGK
jgi:hypothetical protein